MCLWAAVDGCAGPSCSLLSLFQLPLGSLTQILLIKLGGLLPPPVSRFISAAFSQAAEAEQRLDSWLLISIAAL